MLSSKEMFHRQMTQQGCCPECRSTTFVTDRESGEITCYNCGLVLQESLLDHKPEWRAFTPEERRSKVRVGAPTSLKHFDKGLSTTFQPYRDPYGKALPMKERLKMMRLRKWNIRARMHSSAERNLSGRKCSAHLSQSLRSWINSWTFNPKHRSRISVCCLPINADSSQPQRDRGIQSS
jgi:ribosomal protein L37AE/L43A